jgi:prolipoprotein diacylglyceryltransferase
MTTLMMGILLILITSIIAIAPFVNIQVPDILNSTFFIILGFFFGQTIGRLASFKETKKSK